MYTAVFTLYVLCTYVGSEERVSDEKALLFCYYVHQLICVPTNSEIWTAELLVLINNCDSRVKCIKYLLG